MLTVLALIFIITCLFVYALYSKTLISSKKKNLIDCEFNNIIDTKDFIRTESYSLRLKPSGVRE